MGKMTMTQHGGDDRAEHGGRGQSMWTMTEWVTMTELADDDDESSSVNIKLNGNVV